MLTKKKININLVFFLIFLLWFITAFIIMPNYEILKTTFFSNDGFSFENIAKIINSSRAMKSIKNSLMLAVALVVTSTAVGVLEVLFIDYFELKGRRFLHISFLIPLIFGGIMLANGYVFTYGSKGIVTKLLLKLNNNLDPYWFQGFGAVLFLMTFACTTNFLIFFKNSFKNIDFQTVEAAKNLGASNVKVIFRIILPTLKPILLTCVILLFQTGLMAMSAPLIIGGKNFETISPLILTFTQRPSSRQLAAILSLFLGIIQFVLLYIIQKNERKGNVLSVSKVKTNIIRAPIKNRFANVVAHIVAYVFAFINLLPLINVLIYSFTDYQSILSRNLSFKSLSLSNYLKILSDQSMYKPFLISIIYSLVSAVIAVLMMIVAARIVYKYKNKLTVILELLIHIPWVLPGIMFSLGLILSYSTPKAIVFDYILTGSLIIMLIAYIVTMLPNTFRFLKASYYSVDQNLENAAKNLGAKPMYTFIKVVLPIILPTVLAMIAINFNGKLGDYDLSVFLYNPAAVPVGVVIKNNTNPDVGVEGIALNLVYSVILMIINTIVFFFVYGNGFNVIKSKLNFRRNK